MRTQRTQFITTGQVPVADSSRYVTRLADSLFDEYLQQNHYIGIIGPRAIGKTSLMTRRHKQLCTQPGILAVYLFMSRFVGPEGAEWYRRLYEALMREIERLPGPPATNAIDFRQGLHDFLRDDPQKRRLIIFLDDIELIPKDVLTEFMAMIREMFSSREVDEVFQRCTFVLGGCFLPNDLIKNPDISPFWIASLIYMTDSDRDGVTQLVSLLHREDREITRSVIDTIYDWTQGDLYLTQRLCQLLDQEPVITARVVDRVVNDELVRDNIFNRVIRRLQKESKVRGVLKAIAQAAEPMPFNRLQKDVARTWLRGVIRENAEHRCVIRNNVYRQVLQANDFLPQRDSTQEETQVEGSNQILDGRYLVEKTDGRLAMPHAEGGQAQIYKATSLESRAVVAIKHLDTELGTRPENVERFMREGEVLRRLNHPNVVRFVDQFQDDEQGLYIVMEFVSGGDLRKLGHQFGVSTPPSQIVRIMRGVAEGLDYIHSQGIIHRDLKPENILLTADMTPRLADFGIARMSSLSTITRVDNLLGTLPYMPPEAFDSGTLTPKWDLWSVGIILFELLARFRPFKGDSQLEVMISIKNDPLPDLRRLNPSLPEDLYDLVEQLLRRDLETRLGTARELADRLAALNL